MFCKVFEVQYSLDTRINKNNRIWYFIPKLFDCTLYSSIYLKYENNQV